MSEPFYLFDHFQREYPGCIWFEKLIYNSASILLHIRLLSQTYNLFLLQSISHKQDKPELPKGLAVDPD